jgi:hypothetical protein
MNDRKIEIRQPPIECAPVYAAPPFEDEHCEEDFVRSLGEKLGCLPNPTTILETIGDLQRCGAVTSEHSPHRGPCYWGAHLNGDALLSWLINRDLELMRGDSYWDKQRQVTLVATGGLLPFAARSDDDVLTMKVARGPHGQIHVSFKALGVWLVGTFVGPKAGEQLLAVRQLRIVDGA